jgi:hypothetical protein
MAENPLDKHLRDVMALVLERLRQIEKARIEDSKLLVAVVRTVRGTAPVVDRQFKAEVQKLEVEQAAHPFRDLDDVYAELIRLLRDPDPPQEDQQERLRRLLESFEGLKQ